MGTIRKLPIFPKFLHPPLLKQLRILKIFRFVLSCFYFGTIVCVFFKAISEFTIIVRLRFTESDNAAAATALPLHHGKMTLLAGKGEGRGIRDSTYSKLL